MEWIMDLDPEAVYIGYNSKPKQVFLEGSSLERLEDSLMISEREVA
jgi:hypothetical protein